MTKPLLSVALFIVSIFGGGNAYAHGWQWARSIVNTPFQVSSRQDGLSVDTAGNVYSAITISRLSTLPGGVTSTFGTVSVYDSTDACQRFHFHVEGKGFGLFITKTQVEAMNGKIEVESKPGEGTTIHVHLPA